jgi:hypothetical protein
MNLFPQIVSTDNRALLEKFIVTDIVNKFLSLSIGAGLNGRAV